MDQVDTTLQQEIPRESNNLINLFKNLSSIKRLLLIIFFIFVLLIVPAIVIISGKAGNSNKEPPAFSKSTDKTWEIILIYDTNQDKISLKKLTLLNKKITSDYRSAEFSNYKLKVFSGTKSLYETKVVISEQLIYNILNDPDSSESSGFPAQPSELETVLYIPFFDNADKIALYKEETSILELLVQKKNSLNIFNIPQANGAVCRPLTVVFISDQYTDFNKFHQDAQRLIDAYKSTPPYNEAAGMFDFKIVDNAEPLGCEKGIVNSYYSDGTLRNVGCISNTRIEQIATSAYPNASKAIVIANQPFEHPYTGSVLGVTSGIGGFKEVFPNGEGGNLKQYFTQVGKHEFLGHAVGLLYDRYVSSNPSYGLLQNGIRSNCTDNSSGEDFWRQAGTSQVFLGCSNRNQYGSSQLTCNTSNPRLISGGNPNSIMSAVGCGGGSFDAVEQLWIRNQVIPLYQSCPGGTTPMPTLPAGVTPTLTPPVISTPTITGVPGRFSLTVDIWTDNNNDGIRNGGDTPYPGATLNLNNSSGIQIASGITDASGKYTFPNLSPGSYSVDVIISGHTYTHPVDITNENFTLVLRNSSGVSITPPVVITPPITPIQAQTPVPTSGGGGGILTPEPTPQATFNCVEDTTCTSGQKKLQLCPLKCTRI